MIQWENIDKYTQRLRVFSGWIVNHVSYTYRTDSNYNLVTDAVSESSVFIPDPNHEWTFNEEVNVD